LLLSLALTTLCLFTSLLLGSATSIFRGLLPCLLFFGTPKILRLESLALAALVFNTLQLQTRYFFSLATLGVDFVLVLPSLLLENISLDVCALTAYFDVHGTSTTLCAGELQLALRLALECDLPRCSIAVITTSVAAPQMRE